MKKESFGDFVRQRREELNLGLRQFCADLDFDPSRWSKVERGVLQPPSDEDTLRAIRDLLRLRKDSADWTKLKDLADLGRGEIPKDVLNNDELLACLPMVFKTLRNEKPTPKQLHNAFELIRNSDRDRAFHPFFDSQIDLDTLATEQAVPAAAKFNDLLGNVWPEDESVDDFINALRSWRQEEPSNAS